MDSIDIERRFVSDLIGRGYSAEAAGAELIALGWHPSSAKRAVDAAAAGAVAASTPVPGPDLGQLPSTIDCGDVSVDVLLRSHRPQLCLLGRFLDTQECTALMEASLPRLQRSRVYQDEASAERSGVVAYSRTSEQTSFAPGENALVDRLRRRAAAATRWPEAQMENLQIVRYRPGGDFAPHHDYFCPQFHADFIEREGQRVGTLLMYLNTPPCGGATAFCDVELEILPQRGNALFFGYSQPSADSLTLHAGVPLVEGEKWIATFFLLDRAPRATEAR